MRLKAVRLRMNDKVAEDKYRYVFNDHVYFIGYYIAMQLRKEKIESGGPFEGIFIKVGEDDGPDSIRDNGVWKFLDINLKFDFERYDNSDEPERCRYYIELYKEALDRASRIAPVPYDRIMGYLDALVADDYVYTWKFSHLILRQYGLKLYFTARLTTNDFTIHATVFKGRDKEPVCQARVIRTEPDSICFGNISKKIYMDDGKVFIGTRLRPDLFYINISDLSKSHFVLFPCAIPSDARDHDKKYISYFQKVLQYDGSDTK